LESNWKFQRGDIYFVKLEAGVGSEQNGARPAVIPVVFSFSKEPNPEAFERIRNILLATSYTKKVG
jgi:hypothetical protein